MSSVGEELNAVVGALADCYDQAVFLENAVALVANLQHPKDLMALVSEAQEMIKSGGASLNVQGDWLVPVPDWLKALPNHKRRRSTHSRDSGQKGLLLSFPEGQLAFWDKSADFSANDIRIGETLIHLIVSSLKALEAREVKARALIVEHERSVARQIWHLVIPDVLPAIPNFHLRASSQPAQEIGGDFHCVAHDWLLVGDVSGKGIPAALFSAMFIASFKLAVSNVHPGLALQQALFDNLEQTGMFATVAGVRLSSSGELHYFNLGHPPIFVVRLGGVEELKATAPPMGTFPLNNLTLKTRQLHPGDLICLYSDGVSEAKRFNGHTLELFGLQRISKTISAAQGPEEALSAILEKLEGWEIDDDLTLVVAQYQPGSGVE